MTPAVELHQLSAVHFRGIREATIALDGKNLLLVGENGSGKSSFVDLLEYLLTGRLDRFRRRDVDESESIPYVDRPKGAPVAVGIVCKTRGKTARISAGYPYRSPSIPSELAEWFGQMRARPPILRRAQVLNFIEARGADRYKQISEIIGLSHVDKVIQTWRGLEKTWHGRADSQEQIATEARNELGKLCTTAIRDDQDLLAAINDRLASAGAPHRLAHMRDMAGCREQVQQQMAALSAASESTKMAKFADELDAAMAARHGAYLRYAELRTAQQDFMKQTDALKEALFGDLLAQGQRILTEHPDLTACPLCQSAIDPRVILPNLRRRLDDLKATQEKQQQLEHLRVATQRQAAIAVQMLAAARVSAYAKSVPALSMLHDGLEQLELRLAPAALDVMLPAVQELHTGTTGDAMTRVHDEIASFREALQRIQPSEQERRTLELAGWLGQIEQAHRSLTIAERGQMAAVLVREHVQKVLGALEHACSERLKEINAQIEQKANGYLQRLHPAEGCGALRLPMEGQGVGLRTGFGRVQGTHPSGFYSEGHLDSMGIALFLAFIDCFNHDAGMLVLDDVMTTIDNGHRQRLARLLAEEFAGYQLILTTHDQFWAEELQNTMHACGRSLTALHLLPWTAAEGAHWKEFATSHWDEYAQRANTHPQSAVADTGRDLEKFLNLMRYNLRLSIPARTDERYMMADLYQPFFSWFKKHRVAHPTVAFNNEVERLQKDLDGYYLLRNWAGAHYNSWGEGLASAEAATFVDLVRQLYSLFECPRCRSLVAYDDGASVIVCQRCTGKRDAPCWQVVGK